MGSSDTYWMTVEWGREGQNEILRSGLNGLRWPYLLLGWDSAWYLSIAEKGYSFSAQSFAFFPGLPLFSNVFKVIVHNSFFALTVFSMLVGLLWIPLYQLVAETYMNRSQALKSTLLYAFVPFVFLFTTVVYSEGLFLFSTLGAWLFFKRKKLLVSMIFTSIATISRPLGLLILLPILVETWQQRVRGSSFKHRHIFYCAIPVLSFLSWLLYCRIMVNDWFAPFNRSAWNDMPALFTLLHTIPISDGIQLFLKNQVWLFFLLTPILVYALLRMDRALALYSIIYYLGILAFGAFVSAPRFISFLFPIWLPMTLKLSQMKQSRVLIVIICVAFYLLGLYLWNGFLNGEFVS
jgi:hypothetical protein